MTRGFTIHRESWMHNFLVFVVFAKLKEQAMYICVKRKIKYKESFLFVSLEMRTWMIPKQSNI
jgi:hypothetical protein